MAEQRARARAAADEAGAAAGDRPVWRELLEELGTTEFTGRQEHETKATVLALVTPDGRVDEAGEGSAVDVVLDRTPFYAESGGQVGDTGTISVVAGGTALDVRDTQYGVAGALVVHECVVRRGSVREGDEVIAAIDSVRRDRIRRNHTATHVLHWALREVLGSHVQQAGSLVAPDRLRFDFSHHEAVTPEELAQVERLANEQVITDAPVRHYETTKAEAERIGAIAFFGEKYGDIVRVLEAGPSTELCGGTHVYALGFIGPIKIVSESSIGSNLRRIEAVTGDGALSYVEDEEALLRRSAALLRAAPKELPERIERLSEQVRSLQEELQRLKAKEALAAASDLARSATEGAVIARHDGLSNDDLRRLAQETVRALGSGVVALAGTGPDGVKAGIAVAVSKDLVARGVTADAIARPAARGARRWGRKGCRRGGRRRTKLGRHRRGARSRPRTASCMAGMNDEPGAAHGPAGRVLGVDLGSVRIGLALSDPTRTVASPHSVLRRARTPDADHRAILDVARANGVTTIVVGLPLSLSGGHGPAARAAEKEIDALRSVAVPDIDVVAHDERLTTITAERSLDEAGLRRADRTAVVDKVAAAVMLQSWLESPAARAGAPGTTATR